MTNMGPILLCRSSTGWQNVDDNYTANDDKDKSNTYTLCEGSLIGQNSELLEG